MSDNRGKGGFARRFQRFTAVLGVIQEELFWGVANELQRKDTEALICRAKQASRMVLDTGEAIAWKICNDAYVFIEKRI